MKTADQILKEHEDANEMHFHQVDREWVIKAMEEYARTVQPWIRPQDQMPERGIPVLITDVDGLQIVAWWDIDYDKWYSENHSWWDGSRWYSENHSWFPREVAYWMPIPEIV